MPKMRHLGFFWGDFFTKLKSNMSNLSLDSRIIKTTYLIFIALLSCGLGYGQIISHYVETDSGNTPKGIEIWNNTASTLDFSTDNLVIEKGTNGGAASPDFTISSGTLASGEVMVIGTADMQSTATGNGAQFFEKAFDFDGNDALVVKYGGTTTDVFGNPGNDPGSSWVGSGVSTANQNIELDSGITTPSSGFTDPSTRFITNNTNPSNTGGLTGFGIAPPGNSNIFEDFTDGDYTQDPVWISVPGFISWILNIDIQTAFDVGTDATIPDGNATTDGHYLAGEGDVNNNIIGIESAEVSEWEFSIATPDFNNDADNYFGFILMGDGDITDFASQNYNGYYIQIGSDNTNKIELWKKPGNDPQTKVGEFSNGPDVGNGELKDGLNIRITRSDAGEFELFYSTGFQYNNPPTTSAGTLTDSQFNTSTYFGIYSNFNNPATDKRIFVDNIDLNPYDQDSKVIAPTTQVASSTIISDEVNSLTESKPVFKFNVEDLGSGDDSATKINQISFVPGPDNTTDWSDVIKGIRVNAGGTNIDNTNQTEVALNDNEITYSFDYSAANVSNNMQVADGTSKEFEIEVYLNENNIVGGEVIQLQIDKNNTLFNTERDGSGLEDTFDYDIIGNQHTISVPSRKLSFIQHPQTSIINEDMNSPVEVAYVDNNGNVNNEETSAIEITSGGSMLNDPITQSPVNGIASFTPIKHDALATDIKLTASTNITGPTDLESYEFDIIEHRELFITEIADPGSDSSCPASNEDAKYIEIYNAGVTPFDLDAHDVYIIQEADAGKLYESTTKLQGIIPPKSYFVISKQNISDFNATYGVDSDQVGPINGDGNDTYSLSTSSTLNTTSNDTGIDTRFDVYGEFGINAFTSDAQDDEENNTTGDDTAWEYEDSRAYRLNPDVKFATSNWNDSEWEVDEDGALTCDMTPGYGDQDYVYVDDTAGWLDIGLGDPNASTPTEHENIFVRSGNVSLTQNTTIGDLVVRTNATLTIESDVVLRVKGDIVNEGKIIFESDVDDTAVLGEMGSTSRVVGDGFQIERYVPATSRSFRYLCASVDTPGTIHDNWQENAASTNDDPHPGYGTHITGGSTSDGFDVNATGNSSLFQYNAASGNWVAKTSTNNTSTDKLLAGDPYAMLIRGDRSATLNSNTDYGPATTLRATGQILTGDVEIGVDVGELAQTQDEFSLVGNPYQAQVNMHDLLKDFSSGLSQSFVYIYDPHITDNGGYATVDLSDPNNVTVDPNISAANKFLQPNQAFFVKTTSNNPSLTFKESVKTTQTSNIATFSDDNASPAQFIQISLYDDDEQELKDGVRVKFSQNYSNQVNNADAPKMWNNLEWFSLVNKSNYLSIESRAIPQQNDTIKFYTGNYQSTHYHFEIKVHEMDYADVQLYDAYLDNYTDLSSGMNSLAFSVDPSVPESIAGDRFQIVFDQISLSTDEQQDKTALQVYPNPVTDHHLFIEGLQKFYASSNVQLKLFDIFGRELYKKSIKDLKKQHKIHLPDVSSGSYLLQLTSGTRTKSFNLLIE